MMMMMISAQFQTNIMCWMCIKVLGLLKQQSSMNRHVSALGHTILIPILVFTLTRPGLTSVTYHTRGGHALIITSLMWFSRGGRIKYLQSILKLLSRLYIYYFLRKGNYNVQHHNNFKLYLKRVSFQFVRSVIKPGYYTYKIKLFNVTVFKQIEIKFAVLFQNYVTITILQSNKMKLAINYKISRRSF